MTSSLAQCQLLSCALNIMIIDYVLSIVTTHHYCDFDDSVCFHIISHHGLADQNEIANHRL